MGSPGTGSVACGRARFRLLPTLALLAAPLTATAQEPVRSGPWLPTRHHFAPLLADPHEARLAAGLIWTDLFAPHKPARERPPFRFDRPEDMRVDLHGSVALGGTFPLWRASPWPRGGIVVGAQAAVFARFRLEEPSRDYAASDWLVALPVELAAGDHSARVRLIHRSAHLGDELIFDTGARRIEFAHEAVELLLARRLFRSARAYAGGAWIFRSNTELEPGLRELQIRDDAALQIGIDGDWYPWADGRAGLLAGIDWQSAQRTGWDRQLSATLGWAIRGAGGGLRIALRYFDGPSSLGEFFLTRESFWGIEFVAAR